MGRQKNDGLGRFGGRQKGTPNKATADVKTWVANILNGGRADFERRLANLEDREFVRTFMGLLGYILPKQQPTSPEAEIEAEYKQMERLIDTLPDEVIDKITEKILKLQNVKQNEQQGLAKDNH